MAAVNGNGSDFWLTEPYGEKTNQAPSMTDYYVLQVMHEFLKLPNETKQIFVLAFLTLILKCTDWHLTAEVTADGINLMLRAVVYGAIILYSLHYLLKYHIHFHS